MSMNQSAIQNHMNQVVSIGLVFVLTLDSWLDLFRRAFAHHDTSHILLAPIVAGFIFLQRWRERGQWIRDTPVSEQYHVLPVLAALLGYLMYQIGATYDWIYLWHIGTLLFVFAVSCRVFDRHMRYDRVYLPCLPLVLFMAPLPGVFQDTINHYLLLMNQMIVLNVLALSQFDFSRSGRVIEVNGQMISIVDACNGLRVFYSMLIVCWYFQVQLMSRMSIEKRFRSRGLIFFLMMPMISLVLNSLRLIVTAIAYGVLSDGQGDYVHEVAGWVLVALVWLIFHRLTRDSHVNDSISKSSSSRSTSSRADQDTALPPWSWKRRIWLAGKCLFLLILLLLQLSFVNKTHELNQDMAQVIQRLPYSADHWIGYDKPVEEISLPSDLNCYLYRYYEGSDHRKRLLMVGLTHIRNLKTHEAAQCYVSRGWKIKSNTIHDAKRLGYESVRVKKTFLTRHLNGERHCLLVQESIVPLAHHQGHALMIHTATQIDYQAMGQFETHEPYESGFNNWALSYIQTLLEVETLPETI